VAMQSPRPCTVEEQPSLPVCLACDCGPPVVAHADRRAKDAQRTIHRGAYPVNADIVRNINASAVITSTTPRLPPGLSSGPAAFIDLETVSGVACSETTGCQIRIRLATSRLDVRPLGTRLRRCVLLTATARRYQP